MLEDFVDLEVRFAMVKLFILELSHSLNPLRVISIPAVRGALGRALQPYFFQFGTRKLKNLLFLKMKKEMMRIAQDH